MKSNTETCQNCHEVIPDHRQPLYPSRDIITDNANLFIRDDPDGPFCGVPCRQEFDGEETEA